MSEQQNPDAPPSLGVFLAQVQTYADEGSSFAAELLNNIGRLREQAPTDRIVEIAKEQLSVIMWAYSIRPFSAERIAGMIMCLERAEMMSVNRRANP